MQTSSGVTVAVMVSGAEAFRKLQVQFAKFGDAIAAAFVPMRDFVGVVEGPMYGLEGLHTPEAARREAERLLNRGPSTLPHKPQRYLSR